MENKKGSNSSYVLSNLAHYPNRFKPFGKYSLSTLRSVSIHVATSTTEGLTPTSLCSNNQPVTSRKNPPISRNHTGPFPPAPCSFVTDNKYANAQADRFDKCDFGWIHGRPRRRARLAFPALE